MWDIIHSNQIQFNESERTEFSSVSAISSNGSTYSIVNNNFVQIFDADTEKLIYYNEIPLGFDFDDPFLMISNGIFILFLFDSGKIFVNAVAKCNNAVFEAGDPFPKDNYSDTKALTLDVLTNSYFSVYYESDNISVINSHPYTGPPDLHIFRLSTDNENEDVEHVLLDLLNHFAFSYSIPDHLVSTDTNCESDIISLTKLIELTEKINEFDAKSLLILLDLNIHKYKCPSTVQQLLPYLLKLMEMMNIKIGVCFDNHQC